MKNKYLCDGGVQLLIFAYYILSKQIMSFITGIIAVFSTLMNKEISRGLLALLLLLPLVLQAGGEELYQIEQREIERTEDYVVYRLCYPSPGSFSFEAGKEALSYLYMPLQSDPERKIPAALCLHILGGNGDVTRMIASYLASRGIAAMMPVLPMFLERTPPGGRKGGLESPQGPRYLGEAFSAIPAELERAVDILAKQPGVDQSNINLIGTSMGGILAVSTAARDARINKAVFLLAGGDLRTIISRDRHEVTPFASALRRASEEERQVLEEAFSRVEPLNFTAALKDKAAAGKIRMINAAEDEVIPLDCTLQLVAGLSLKEGDDFTLMPALGHYTGIAAMPQVLKEVADFFGAAAEPEIRQQSGTAVIKGLFAQLHQLLKWQPAPDKSFKVAARFHSSAAGKTLCSGTASLFGAANGRFRLELKDCQGLEYVDSLAMGRGVAPWVVSENGTAFIGKSRGSDDFSQLLSKQIGTYRMPALMLTSMIAASGSMEAFEKFVKLELVSDADGTQKIVGSADDFRLEITLDNDKNVPSRIAVIIDDNETRIDFSEWALDAPFSAPDFEPPEGAGRYVVDSDLLDQTIAAVFNFAIDRLSK